jgi:hypothetical protein
MSFELLAPYRIVGVDVDDTLLDNGRPADYARFWEFIETNPYDQVFHIITFRSGGWEKMVWSDLRFSGSTLTEDHFASVQSVPHSVWALSQGSAPRIITSMSQLDEDPYMLWKGKVCAELGCEVLIDDMTEHVIRGCDQYGVKHIHPDELFGQG